MEQFKPCPKCGSYPRLVFVRKSRRSPTERGYLCSNGLCSWSYAVITFVDQADATKHWNNKVDMENALINDSEKLAKCKCGGKAKLIFEGWGNGACGWFVRCESCGKLLTAGEPKDEIIKEWNRRENDGNNNI